MSSVLGANEGQLFSVAKYQNAYGNSIPVIQVALWTIVALGLTVSLLSHCGYLDHNFLYAGVGASVLSSLIAFGIFFTKKNYLSTALDDVKKVEELQEIVNTIQASDCNFSLLGCAIGYGNHAGANLDFIITSTKLQGTIANYELQNVIERLLNQSTNNCTCALDETNKLAFEKLCDLANKKCEVYTTYNNFEIPEKYLK